MYFILRKKNHISRLQNVYGSQSIGVVSIFCTDSVEVLKGNRSWRKGGGPGPLEVRQKCRTKRGLTVYSP